MQEMTLIDRLAALRRKASEADNHLVRERKDAQRRAAALRAVLDDSLCRGGGIATPKCSLLRHANSPVGSSRHEAQPRAGNAFRLPTDAAVDSPPRGSRRVEFLSDDSRALLSAARRRDAQRAASPTRPSAKSARLAFLEDATSKSFASPARCSNKTPSRKKGPK
jgi:hypothetical protein